MDQGKRFEDVSHVTAPLFTGINIESINAFGIEVNRTRRISSSFSIIAPNAKAYKGWQTSHQMMNIEEYNFFCHASYLGTATIS